MSGVNVWLAGRNKSTEKQTKPTQLNPNQAKPHTQLVVHTHTQSATQSHHQPIQLTINCHDNTQQNHDFTQS